MATGTAGTSARQFDLQGLHYLRKAVAFNTSGISSGVAFPNPLPAGAKISQCDVYVTAAFNAGSTNVLTVGQNASSYNDIVASGDVDESATGGTKVLTGMDLNISSDVTVYVKYTQTGGAATTGAATICIAYYVDNDA